MSQNTHVIHFGRNGSGGQAARYRSTDGSYRKCILGKDRSGSDLGLRWPEVLEWQVVAPQAALGCCY